MQGKTYRNKKTGEQVVVNGQTNPEYNGTACVYYHGLEPNGRDKRPRQRSASMVKFYAEYEEVES